MEDSYKTKTGYFNIRVLKERLCYMFSKYLILTTLI